MSSRNFSARLARYSWSQSFAGQIFWKRANEPVSQWLSSKSVPAFQMRYETVQLYRSVYIVLLACMLWSSLSTATADMILNKAMHSVKSPLCRPFLNLIRNSDSSTPGVAFCKTLEASSEIAFLRFFDFAFDSIGSVLSAVTQDSSKTFYAFWAYSIVSISETFCRSSLALNGPLASATKIAFL